jgi:hypothetical protein
MRDHYGATNDVRYGEHLKYLFGGDSLLVAFL